jgi:hypothetical protein
MARRNQEREIGGAVWAVTQFPAGEGLGLLTRLLKLLGPALGALAKGGGTAEDGAGGREEALTGLIVSGLLQQLDEKETVALVKRLLADTRKDGVEILPIFDTEFMGDYANLFRVLGFVLEVNYGGFFSGIGRGARKEAPAPSPS